MVTVVRTKIEGVAELKAALEELGEVVATKIGVKANRDSATQLMKVLAEAAPYDATHRKKYWKRKNGTVATAYYGHLRDAIRVRKVKAQNANTIVHLVSTGDAFWGNFQEFGTVRMPARPWWRPAVDVVYSRILSIQISGLSDGIEREAKRIARKNRVRGA